MLPNAARHTNRPRRRRPLRRPKLLHKHPGGLCGTRRSGGARAAPRWSARDTLTLALALALALAVALTLALALTLTLIAAAGPRWSARGFRVRVT